MSEVSTSRHPIAVVARRTGLRVDVIRAWERRYGVVAPERTPGNRRLYSDAQVRRLLLLREVTDAGWQIGQVAGMGDEELRSLLDGSPRRPVLQDRPEVARRDLRVEERIDACIHAITELDGTALKRNFELASMELSRVDLLDRLMVPLLRRIGSDCASGRLRAANEHLATMVLRSFLDSLQPAYAPGPSVPSIVVTTPSHQHHELGCLLVAATARTEGWRTVYLGPNLPAEEIAGAVAKRNAAAVALSITFPPDDPQLPQELRRLGRLLGDETQILVGGRSAGGYKSVLDEIDAVHMEHLGHLREQLQTLRLQPPPKRRMVDLEQEDEPVDRESSRRSDGESSQEG